MSASPVSLNAQVIVNCQAGGSCNGGNPARVYEFAHLRGIPHGSCEQYTAYNLVDRMCTDIDVCRDCSPPVPAQDDTSLSGCRAVEHTKYYVSEHYNVRGVDQMKAELAAHGPISCGVHVTDKFEAYDGTYIYSEHVLFPIINHEISVVGYGKDAETGQEYWIGRNSWGTYWGDYGFFYIDMYKDNLAITTDCVAGTPSYTKTTDEVFMQ